MAGVQVGSAGAGQRWGRPPEALLQPFSDFMELVDPLACACAQGTVPRTNDSGGFQGRDRVVVRGQFQHMLFFPTVWISVPV